MNIINYSAIGRMRSRLAVIAKLLVITAMTLSVTQAAFVRSASANEALVADVSVDSTTNEPAASSTEVAAEDTATKQPEATESAPQESEAVVEQLTAAPEVAQAVWQSDADGTVTTTGAVTLGTKYVYPGNSDVTVTFTQLPENPGTLSIKELQLSVDQQEELKALSNVAYDITSSMENGTFAYDLTLPMPQNVEDIKVSVAYSEDLATLDDASMVTQEVAVAGDAVQVEDLNHFTVFAVVKSPLILNCVLTVPLSYILGNCFSTLQAAVNAASNGDTIKVAPGTFTEQVVINKNLTIEGGVHLLLPGSTKIKAPTSMTTGLDGTKSVIVIGNNKTVTLKNLTITGPGSSGCNSINYGIFVIGGATLKAQNVKIENIRDNPISGCQNGIGIRAGSAYLEQVGHVEATNVQINGYQKAGIVVDGSGSSATITGSTITGAGQVNYIAQNGIQVSRGATATISNNTISGNRYTNAGDSDYNEGAAGILLYQAGTGVSLSNNTISGNSLGIASYDDVFATGNPVTLDSNAFSGNYRDIDNYDNDDIDALNTTSWSASGRNAIEALINHDCVGSPYPHGTCNSSDYTDTVDEDEDSEGPTYTFGSVRFAEPEVDLALAQTINNNNPNSGAAVILTFTITNNGLDTAANVTMVNNMPAGLTIVNTVPSQGAYDANTSMWTVGSIAGGAVATLTINATNNVSGGQSASVTAAAQTDTPETDSSNNQATVSFTSAAIGGGGSGSGSGGGGSGGSGGGSNPPSSPNPPTNPTPPTSNPTPSTPTGNNGGNTPTGNAGGGSVLGESTQVPSTGGQNTNGAAAGNSDNNGQAAEGSVLGAETAQAQESNTNDASGDGNSNSNTVTDSAMNRNWLWILLLIILAVIVYYVTRRKKE